VRIGELVNVGISEFGDVIMRELVNVGIGELVNVGM